MRRTGLKGVPGQSTVIMALVRCRRWSSVVCCGRTLVRVLPRSVNGHPKLKGGYFNICAVAWDPSLCACVSTSPVEGNRGLPRVLSADAPSAAEGKYLIIKFDNSQQSQLISQWLRQSCHCPECIDPGSNQRKVYADKLLGSPRLQSAHIAGISLPDKKYIRNERYRLHCTWSEMAC